MTRRAADPVALFQNEAPLTLPPDPADDPAARLLERVRREGPVLPLPGGVVGIFSPALANQVDKIKDKGALLPFIAKVSEGREFAAVHPLSALKLKGLEALLGKVAQATVLLPVPGRCGRGLLLDQGAMLLMHNGVGAGSAGGRGIRHPLARA